MTVRLITGPPGAGKNTYIEKNKKPEDVIFDFDILKDMTGGSIERAEVMREAFENDLQNYTSDVWVIRCVADPKARTELATRLKAEQVVVLETPADVAKEQVTKRGRNPERNSEVHTAIDNWWSQYGVVESDLIVRPDKGHPNSDRKKNMANTENEASGPEDNSDKGFPAQTKIADMTPEQQAAYWKFQSRKHEGNVTNLRTELDKRPPAVKQQEAPKPDAEEAPLDRDALRKELLADIKREQAPELVRTQFEALIGDRLPEATRVAILEDMDLLKFVNEDGSLDKDRIKSKAELLVPVVDGNVRKQRSHQGPRRQEATATVQTGKDLFESFSKKR